MPVASPLGGILSDRAFGGRRWPVLLLGNVVSVATLAAVPFVSHSLVTVVLMTAYASVSLCCGFALGALVDVSASALPALFLCAALTAASAAHVR